MKVTIGEPGIREVNITQPLRRISLTDGKGIAPLGGYRLNINNFSLPRNISLKTVKNALSFGRRRSASASEEQNLLGSSQEHTDRDTEDEAGPRLGESCDEADTARSRRESGVSCASDNRSVLSVTDEKRRSKKSKK